MGKYPDSQGCSVCRSRISYWLVARKRYLIDGIGVAAWLFWEFFHARWKILFWVEGSTRGENMYTRWECVLKVGMRWLWVVEWVREVRVCTRGENVYARWECVHEVTLNGGGGTRGENMYVRWECVHEVRMCTRGDFEWWRGAHKVRICTRGENMHMRWLWGVEGTTLHRGPKVTSCGHEVT